MEIEEPTLDPAVARITEPTPTGKPTLVVAAALAEFEWIYFEKPGRPDTIRVVGARDADSNIDTQKYVRIEALPGPLRALVRSYLDGNVPDSAFESMFKHVAKEVAHPTMREGVGAGEPCPECASPVGTLDPSGHLVFHRATCSGRGPA